jgi:hypothetical protein
MAKSVTSSEARRGRNETQTAPPAAGAGARPGAEPAALAGDPAAAIAPTRADARDGGAGGHASRAVGGGGVPIPSDGGSLAPLDGFTIVESLLAAACGVPVDAFAEARKKIARGEGWQLVENSVAYSEEGAAACLLELGLAEKTPGGQVVSVTGFGLEAWFAVARQKPREKPPEEVRVVVVRFPPNPKMMWCKRLDEPKAPLVLVWVTQRAGFAPGMELRARPVAQKDYLEAVGKLPRGYGKW